MRPTSRARQAARNFRWDFLRPDVPVSVEVTSRKSRIYHAGAATQRIETAIHEELGAPLSPDAELCIMARFEDNLCTISLDTSGTSLYKRGYKEAVAKAPMRETMASLFLRQCGYDGQEPCEPMSARYLIMEAAEIAAKLNPVRRAFFFRALTSSTKRMERRAIQPTQKPARISSAATETRVQSA